MINGFIKNIQYFTIGIFKKLLDYQIHTYKNINKDGFYDDEKKEDLDIAIKSLSTSNEVISFDKIRP